MTNILYILHSSDSSAGSGKAAQHIIDNLPKNIKAFVILPSVTDLYDYFQVRQIPTYIVRVCFSAYPPIQNGLDILLCPLRIVYRLLINLFAIIFIIRLVKQNKIDIIHTNTSVLHVGFWAAKICHIHHIWHIREYGDIGLNLTFFPTNCLHKKLLRQSNCIAITQDLIRHNELNKSNKQIALIYDGVISKDQIQVPQWRQTYVLYVGRLEPMKGIDNLISAYAQYVQNEAQPLPLWVVGYTGNKEYENFLCQRVREFHLESYVTFLGKREDVLQLMHQATVVVVPSECEGFGFITAEAMSQGTLVIAKDLAGTKEQLDNGVNYTGHEIALRYHSQDELIAYLHAITSHEPIFYKPIIDKALQTIEHFYTIENSNKQVYTFYQKIL